MTHEHSQPLSSASPDLSAILAFVKQRSKTLTERICQSAWKMKDGVTVSNWCLFSSAMLCQSFPSGWHRYTLCAEKQCPCYNFFNIISVHTFTDFVLLSHNMQSILYFGRKEDEVHCNVPDPQKHIKTCSCGLVKLLRFSENSLRYFLFFSYNTMNILKILIT